MKWIKENWSGVVKIFIVVLVIVGVFYLLDNKNSEIGWGIVIMAAIILFAIFDNSEHKRIHGK